VRGCIEWQRDGLGVPEEVRAATDAYREEMDTLAEFLEQRCTVREDVSVRADFLYNDYSAHQRGERYVPASRTFNARMVARGFDKRRGTGGYMTFYGIGLSA
jgi:putative DNA primase/helicase